MRPFIVTYSSPPAFDKEKEVNKKKILVTGIAGYIGSALVNHLDDYNVTGIDTGFYRERKLYYDGEDLPHTYTADIRFFPKERLEEYEAVIYLSELSNDALGQLSPELTYTNNHRGCINFAVMCKEAGIKKFIYSSSCSVYGTYDDAIKTEKSGTNPLSEYAKCKLLNEKSLIGLADKNFCPVLMRNATAYGPSPSMRFDLCINNMVGDSWVYNRIKIDNEGLSWRPFVHVDDICRAFITALEAPDEIVCGQIFNVGSDDQNYQIKDVAKIILKECGAHDIIYEQYLSDKRSYRIDFNKISRSLNFTCTKKVEDGIRDLIRIFRKIEFNEEMLKCRVFRRLNQIQYLLKTRLINDQLFWEFSR